MMHDHLDSPDTLLASLLSERSSEAEIIFLTGASGAGKTLFCLRLAEKARQSGKTPAGLISPAVYAAGFKVGIDLLDVQSGERRRLADRRTSPREPGLTPLDSLGWVFDEAVLEWGNRRLGGQTGGELLIIDELGPLELLHGVGWTAGLDLLDHRCHQLSVVVVRPSLIEKAARRWPWGRQVTIQPGSFTRLDTLQNRP